MIKFSKKLLHVFNISTGVLAVLLGLLALNHFRSQSVSAITTLEFPRDPFLNKMLFTPESEPSPTATLSADTFETTTKRTISDRLLPSPTPTVPWMQFNGISILNLPSIMTFEPGCKAAPFTLPTFKVLSWTSDVLESGVFNVGRKTAVAWEHLGYTGLWIHSGIDWLGRPLEAFPLQNYLEKINSWKYRTPQEFDQNANNCLIGSTVTLKIGDDILKGKVTAVLRIPVTEITDVSSHVMDLVPYLAETYPESGFDKLQAPELLLYSCGRRLSTEKEDPSVQYYAQSRIIVAIDFDT